MSKTHPVAMPYPLNGASNIYNFVANGPNIESTEWVADPMATNKIRLFKDDGTGNIIAGVDAGKTGIECTSCHDVHNGARVKDVMLLTGKLTGVRHAHPAATSARSATRSNRVQSVVREAGASRPLLLCLACTGAHRIAGGETAAVDGGALRSAGPRVAMRRDSQDGTAARASVSDATSLPVDRSEIALTARP